MESEKVKEIKKALEFQRDSLGDGLVYLKDNVVEYVSCKDILTYIDELEIENARIKQSAKNLAFVNEKVIEENKKLKDRKEKEIIEKFTKEVYKELYQLGRIYALPETFDADKYGLFSITQEVVARIAKEQFNVEIKE